MKAVIDRSDLARALGNGIVSTSREKNPDTLAHLELTFTPETGELQVVATDSYMLTRETITADLEAGEPTTVLLHREDADRIVKALKSTKVVPIVFELVDAEITVKADDTFVGCRDRSEHVSFPNWQKIIADQPPAPEAVDMIALMGARLAGLSKLKSETRDTMIVFSFAGSPLKPARFRLEHSTLEGLVMPVQIS